MATLEITSERKVQNNAYSMQACTEKKPTAEAMGF